MEMAVVTGHFKVCLEGPTKSKECVSLLYQPQSAVCSQSVVTVISLYLGGGSEIQVIYAAPVATTSPAD
jgi:hypothetical protein